MKELILFASVYDLSMFTVFCTTLAGIGIFLLGLRVLSIAINKAAGFAFQRFSASITGSIKSSIFWGLLAGFITQSSRTLSVLFATLVRGGITSPAAAFPFLIWANLGCLFILFALVFPFKNFAFILMGVSGFLFSIGKPSRFKLSYSMLMGIGLTLFGLSLISEYSGQIVQFPSVRDFLEYALSNPFMAVFAGFILVILTQSYPAMTLIIISAAGDSISWSCAMHLSMGVHLGSSVNAFFVGFDFKGLARQCIYCVFYYYIFLALLFYLLWGAYALFASIPLEELIARRIPDVSSALAYAILLINLLSVILLTFFRKIYGAFIAKISPELKNEHSARPKFIALSSLANPALALDLALNEHMRLVRRFPNYMNLLKAKNFNAFNEEEAAFVSVRTRLHDFLDEIVKSSDTNDVMEKAVALKARDDASMQIVQTISSFGQKIANPFIEARGWEYIKKIFAVSEKIIEAFESSIEDPTAENLRDFLSLSKSFEQSSLELQAEFFKSYADMRIYEKALLLRITGIYERLVWLLYRYAVSMAESDRSYLAAENAPIYKRGS